MSSDKPGPDGFTTAYSKKMWPVMYEDIVEMARVFANTGFLPTGLNSSFICSIPKKDSPQQVSDFRPIS